MLIDLTKHETELLAAVVTHATIEAIKDAHTNDADTLDTILDKLTTAIYSNERN